MGSLLLAISTPHAIADNLPSPSFSDKDGDEFFWLGIEHFAWDEYNDDHGNQLGNWVSEYGPRFHWGKTKGTDWLTRSGSFYRDTIDSSIGVVRYDGGLVDDPSYELKHYTFYTGKEWSRQWGHRFSLSDTLSISPVASLGLKAWIRAFVPKKVPDPENPGDTVYAGGTEIFLEPMTKLGLSVGLHLDDGYRITLEAGQQRPLITIEWHDEGGFLKPEPNWNDYAALELSRYGQDGFFARLDYQDKVYDVSNLNSKEWFQPESHETTIGLTLGWKL